MFAAPFPVGRQPSWRRILVSSLLVAAALWPATARAQQVAEGYAGGPQAVPAAASLALATAQGLVLFDGMTVTLTPPQQPAQVLLQLPVFAFGSFLLSTDAGHVLFGCTGGPASHDLWHLALQGPQPPQPLATLLFNYDAAMLDATHALVSARTGGFSAPDNELWLLDLVGGALQRVASIPGASGPVAVAANGDVYYATGYAGFPVPPGATRIVRFARPLVDLAIATHRVLGPQHAEAVIAGLDAAGDMAFDDDGDLLFVDWFNSRVSEVSDATGPQPKLVSGLVDYATANVFPVTVQFVPGGASGVFEPFQPANGSLLVFETDYAATSQVRSLRAAPAVLATTIAPPIPAGAFAFATSGGPAAGLGLLALGVGSAPGTIVLQVPGFEAPLAWSNALLGSPAIAALAFDAAGNASLSLVNPGFASGLTVTVQVAFVSTANAIGATAPLSVMLGP
jgi:hypothetical protein